MSNRNHPTNRPAGRWRFYPRPRRTGFYAPTDNHAPLVPAARYPRPIRSAARRDSVPRANRDSSSANHAPCSSRPGRLSGITAKSTSPPLRRRRTNRTAPPTAGRDPSRPARWPPSCHTAPSPSFMGHGRRRRSVGCACSPHRTLLRYASNPGPSSGCLRAYSTVAWR